MNSNINMLTKAHDEVISELIEAFTENNDLDEIAKIGLEHLGYENMSNEDLEAEYESQFNEDIKIVD